MVSDRVLYALARVGPQLYVSSYRRWNSMLRSEIRADMGDPRSCD